MDIADWRRQIDDLDRELVRLLNQRCRCAQAIGRLKRERGMGVYEPKRETEVFANIEATNRELGGPLSATALHRLFERIIDEMRSIQKEDAS